MGYTKEKTKGRDNLRKILFYYEAIGKIAKRFGIRRATVARLTEIYLKEMGDEIRMELREFQMNDELRQFTDGKTINDQGWDVIRGLIYACRNGYELLRVRRIEAEGKSIQD